ncbi:PD-(D/E)XK nuclease family protein [Herbiconiux liukaitaii]|uniref:PD-(D/E)XK nuclease family protein n=1 Tax=Herbiconiux liukaitaii TaxID=3342799 RepID=UPI0035B756C9
MPIRMSTGMPFNVFVVDVTATSSGYGTGGRGLASGWGWGCCRERTVVVQEWMLPLPLPGPGLGDGAVGVGRGGGALGVGCRGVGRLFESSPASAVRTPASPEPMTRTDDPPHDTPAVMRGSVLCTIAGAGAGAGAGGGVRVWVRDGVSVGGGSFGGVLGLGLDGRQGEVLAAGAGESFAVVGAPGSGKTTVLLELVADRVQRLGFAPEEVLVLAPSRQAATRLRDRVALRLGVPSNGPLARTANSAAFEIVRRGARGGGSGVGGAPGSGVLGGAGGSARPVALLTGAEQDRIVAELLQGGIDDEQTGTARVVWPESLPAQVRSLREFRTELRELLMRTTENGVSPPALVELGRRGGIPEWEAAGAFFAEYQAILESYDTAHLDSAELLAEARRLLRDEHRAATRFTENPPRSGDTHDPGRAAGPGAPNGSSGPDEADVADGAAGAKAAVTAAGAMPGGGVAAGAARIRLVVADDFPEYSVGAVNLVREYARGGAAVVAFGDPDTATAGFRGSDVRALGRLGQTLGVPTAPTIVLQTTYRQHGALRELTQRVTERIGTAAAGLQRRTHEPHPAPAPASVEVGPAEPHPVAAPAAVVAGRAEPRAAAAPSAGGETSTEPRPVAVPAPVADGPADPPAGAADAGRTFPRASGVAGAAAATVQASGISAHGAGAGRGREGRVLRIQAENRTSEIATIARLLRERFLLEGTEWSQMAVIVRSGSLVPAIARGLALAEVPTRTLSAVQALRDDYAARHLAEGLALGIGRLELTAETASSVILGPLCGVDAVGLRRLRLALRHDELAHGGSRHSDELLCEAVLMPGVLTTIDSAPARRVAALGTTLAMLRASFEAGATVEELLWELWQRTGLASRWGALAAGTGILADEANRNLDGAVALFTAARRAVEREPDRPAELFIDEFLTAEVPEDTLSPRSRADSVLVTTPSGAVGVDVDVVVVAGLQESVWPNLRLRGSLLHAQRLGEAALDARLAGGADVRGSGADSCLGDGANNRMTGAAQLGGSTVPSGAADLGGGTRAGGVEGVDVPLGGSVEDVRGGEAGARLGGDGDGGRRGSGGGAGTRVEDSRAEVLSDELRMFALAVSRSRRVTVLSGVANDDEQPSAFLALAPEAETVKPVRHPLSLRGLTGHLRRRLAEDGDQRAASALARLAAEGVPGAHPQSWYGLLEASTEEPVVDPLDEEAVVRVSPSRIEAFEESPLMWFVDQVAGGAKGLAAGIGTIVHSVMEQLAADPDTDPSPEELLRRSEERWKELRFEAPWIEERERRALTTKLEGLSDYLRGFSVSGGELLGAEAGFRYRQGRAEVNGSIDRIEERADGTVVVIDLKTGKYPASRADMPRHAQLASYQLAVHRRALRPPEPPRPASDPDPLAATPPMNDSAAPHDGAGGGPDADASVEGAASVAEADVLDNGAASVAETDVFKGGAARVAETDAIKEGVAGGAEADAFVGGVVGGAELLYVAKGDRDSRYTVRRQEALGEEELGEIASRIEAVAEGMAAATFRGVAEPEERDFQNRYEYRIQLIKAVSE